MLLFGSLLLLFIFSACNSEDDSGSSKKMSNADADDLTDYQWHLNNTGQSAFASENGSSGEDINQAATYADRITGNGVIVAVVDTGLEIAHSDLNANVVSGESWDFWNLDSNPTNNFDDDGDHGTSVAGIIAAEDNSIGGRGIAPNASLKGFNFINSAQDEQIEALGGSDGSDGKSPKSNDVDIFNMSYGTSNTSSALIDTDLKTHLKWAVNNLRSNKGAIYVKSAGNGFEDFGTNSNQDNAECANANDKGISCQNVNMDPTSATPWMINVGALNADGKRSSYSTAGSGLWISAPGGEYGYDQTYGWSRDYPITSFQPAIITTDQSGCDKGYSSTVDALYPNSAPGNRLQDNSNGLNGGCNFTSTFNGTSSAAPVVSGGIALMLEANPSLTWRDVKHILASTARKVDGSHTGVSVNLADGAYQANLGWVENSASYNYHNWYGFGALNVDAAVTMAKGYSSGWGAQTTADASTDVNATIPNDHKDGITDQLTITTSLTIEAVQVDITVSHNNIGNIGVELESPNGTASILFNILNGFEDSIDLDTMALISNAFYGEDSSGDWTLKVVDGSSDNAGGTLDWWKITIYGH